MDPGIRSMPSYLIDAIPSPQLNLQIAQYLNDLWLFDTQEYKWHQIEFGVNDRKPSYVEQSSS